MFCGCPERGEQNDISPHKTAERFLCAVGVYGDSFHSNSLRINLLRLAAHLCGGACLSCSAVAPKGASRTTFPRIKPQSGFYAPSVYMVTVFIVTPCVSAAGCGQPALRYKLKMRCGAGGRGRTPPLRMDRGRGAGGIRIATPACGLARNDRDFWHGGAGLAGQGERPSFPY